MNMEVWFEKNTVKVYIFKKCVTVKNTLSLTPLKTLPLASTTLVPSLWSLSEAIREVLFP